MISMVVCLLYWVVVMEFSMVECSLYLGVVVLLESTVVAGFGGLNLYPEAAWDNSFMNLLFLNVNLLLPSTLVMQSWSILMDELTDV